MDPEQRDRRSEQRLSPQAAFVVQFVAGSDLRAGSVGGRVEHVASGRCTRFESVDGLLRFLGDVLAQPSGEPAPE
jgi:hypothetical protein